MVVKRIKNFVSLNRDQKLFPQIINKYYRFDGAGIQIISEEDEIES